MSNKRDALMQVIGKVGKILPLLASDKVGEVANAAGQLMKVLASVQLDLHDVVALLNEEPVPKPTNGLFETDPEALLRIASDGASFFLNLDHVAYADIDIDGHRETWALTSTKFSDWLMERFYTLKGRIPTATHMKSAIRSISAKASFSSKERHDVHTRFAEFGGKIYLDLADDAWRVIEIDSEGWRVTGASPVRFRRTAGMRAITVPQRGGSINDLRAFVNLTDADRFTDDVKNRASVHLFGHKHRQRIDRDPNYVTFSAGAVNPDRQEKGWSPGYNFIRLALKTEAGAEPKLAIEAHLLEWQMSPEGFRPILDYGKDVHLWDVRLRNIHPVPTAAAVAPASPVAHRASDGTEAVMSEDRARSIVLRFWNLDMSDRRDISRKLKLIEHDEKDLPLAERFGRALLRAGERRQLDELDREIEKREKR